MGERIEAMYTETCTTELYCNNDSLHTYSIVCNFQTKKKETLIFDFDLARLF